MTPVKRLLAIVLSINLCGCSSYYVVTPVSGDIQEDIRSGKAVREGDRVRLETTDDQVVTFTVIDLSRNDITGKHNSVAINDVHLLQIRKISVAKTALLGVGTVAVVAMVAAYGAGLGTFYKAPR